jgi:hypothetical protein
MLHCQRPVNHISVAAVAIFSLLTMFVKGPAGDVSGLFPSGAATRNLQ